MVNTQGLRLVGKGTPIRQLVKLHRRPMEFPFHVWGTRISEDVEGRIAESVDRFVGCGISEDNQQAIAAACGEALERYTFALTNERLETLPIESNHSVNAEFLFNLPFLLPRSVDRQTWCEQAIKSSSRWLSCWQVNQDQQWRETKLPVEFVTPLGTFNLFQTTNGMACGTSLVDAMQRGLKEVVERDALMLVWSSGTAGKMVKLEDYLPPHYLKSIYRMAQQQVTTLLREITTVEGYKVFLGIIAYFPPEGHPSFAFGAGADTNAKDAAKHAFREACLGWKSVSWRVGEQDFFAFRQNPSDSLPSSFSQHAELYFNPEMFAHVSFLFESENQQKSGQVKGILQPIETDIFLLDLTPSDVREMGFSIVKVIVPGLVPFYIGDLVADELAKRRLPIRVGGVNVPSNYEFNHLPHPWP